MTLWMIVAIMYAIETIVAKEKPECASINNNWISLTSNPKTKKVINWFNDLMEPKPIVKLHTI